MQSKEKYYRECHIEHIVKDIFQKFIRIANALAVHKKEDESWDERCR